MAKGSVGSGEIKAFLGEGTEFKGILTFEGIVRVDGSLEGEVVSKDTLIIGESATVNAEITIKDIVISGTVRGNINASGKIEIQKPGKVYGNIKTPSLYIAEGVVFEGSCSMVSQGGQVENKVASISGAGEDTVQAE